MRQSARIMIELKKVSLKKTVADLIYSSRKINLDFLIVKCFQKVGRMVYFVRFFIYHLFAYLN